MTSLEGANFELFSGDVFASPIAPLGRMDVNALWRSAYAESKRRRTVPGFDIFEGEL